MTEHLSSHTIDFLAGRRLAPEDLLIATRHLATCVECRQRASEAAEVIGRAQHFGADLQLAPVETVHVDYEQLEAYVDDSLPIKERETVKRHFGSCVACLEEAREIESLRDNLTSYPALAGVAVDSRKQQEHSWDRLAGFLRMRPRQLAFLAAAFALIAGITALVLWRTPPRQIANRNSAPTNSNEANQNGQVAEGNTIPSNSNQVAPNGGTELTVASPYESIIRPAMETQRLPTPAVIRDVTGKESKLLGSSEIADRFALVSPVGTLVRSNRPTLRWQNLPGAISYSVAIFDLNLNLIEKSSPATKLSWAPLRQLKRNVVYIWQVTAVKDGREITAPTAPASEARFKILSSDRAAALTRASTELAGSHLQLGIVYAHDGLLDDAEREFRAAIAADQDAAIARKLLQGVRQMRR